MSIKFCNPETVPMPAAGYSKLAIIPANRRLPDVKVEIEAIAAVD